MLPNNYDLLNQQIVRAEKLLKQYGCPYTASFESIYWSKEHGNTWHIMCGSKPLTECPAAIRIEAVRLIPGLHEAIIKAKEDADSDAGKSAKQLSLYLDFLEKEL